MVEQGHDESPTGYIVHHLKHLKVGDGFWTFHVDTLLVSGSLAALVAYVLYCGARSGARVSGAPSGLRAVVEWIYEFVDDSVADIYHGNRSFLVALGFSLFTWVVAMNAMDLLPLDVPGTVAGFFGAEFFRAVPTADLNGTVAMALVIFTLIVGYAIRAKGIGGYLHEWISSPFGSNPLLWLPNILLNAIELISKPISLSMRLFGNMYSGEILFMLIALLGMGFAVSIGGIALFIGQVVFGAAWSIFHILIVLLQAYIFMMLPIVYIAMAEEHH
ncbi:MAG: F0F1 ATP synthase subunit A [Gammaproteobacteria bacterium]|nr:F0F1 ATP synthase subunit A [Gammaproteobacteria bacterium]